MGIFISILKKCSKGSTHPVNERSVQDAVRLEASQLGIRLWRNNVGCFADNGGRLVRYGLANDSAATNAVMKSGDLIGIRPVLIEQRHVGTTIGQFVSRECKASGWKPDKSDRTKAQMAWCNLINSLGGDAQIVTSIGSL